MQPTRRSKIQTFFLAQASGQSLFTDALHPEAEAKGQPIFQILESVQSFRLRGYFPETILSKHVICSQCNILVQRIALDSFSVP